MGTSIFQILVNLIFSYLAVRLPPGQILPKYLVTLAHYLSFTVLRAHMTQKTRNDPLDASRLVQLPRRPQVRRRILTISIYIPCVLCPSVLDVVILIVGCNIPRTNEMLPTRDLLMNWEFE